MIVTELVTNAYKYAYPLGTSGDIRVKLKRGEAGTVSLVIEDDGVGWGRAGKPRGTGLGTRIVRAMAAILPSDIVFEQSQPGTRVRMNFAA